MRFMPSQPVGFNRMQTRGVGTRSTIATDQRRMRIAMPRSSTLPYIGTGAVDANQGTPIIASTSDLVDGQPSTTTGIPITIPPIPGLPVCPYGLNTATLQCNPAPPPVADNKILGMDPGVAAIVGIAGASLLIYFFSRK